MFRAPSDNSLVFNSLVSHLPVKIMSGLFEYLSKSDPRLGRGREAREVAREVARELVKEKSGEILSRQGNGAKDVMSLLGMFSVLWDLHERPTPGGSQLRPTWHLKMRRPR